LDLGLYFLSTLGIAIDLRKPKLYEFEFGESKIHLHPSRCHAYAGQRADKLPQLITRFVDICNVNVRLVSPKAHPNKHIVGETTE
jgi:hypothetical protein